MRVYLDNCSLQRPLDDRSQARIALEAEAILAILALCERGLLTFVSSDVLSFEVSQNPHPQRKIFAESLIAQAGETIALTDEIIKRAKELEQQGIKAIDALHLASAESLPVDFFCTCDDRFYRRAKGITSLTIIVLTPLALAQEVMP